MTPAGDEPPSSYASPPCFLHEIDPAYAGLPMAAGAGLEWRKAERQRLIAERMAIEVESRLDMGQAIAEAVEAVIGDPKGRIVSAYWPFRGEPDLRGMMQRLTASGAECALPVVIARGQPLVFRAWASGEPLERGVWSIPVPAEGREVVPDVVIAPVVGFDRRCYRLGYGGGFFDRTLAALRNKPQIIGVGASHAEIPTIHPQPHDVPMDMIVTEREILKRLATEK